MRIPVNPLRFSFNSGRDYTSPYLGKGWWIPLLESNAIQIREKMMKVNLLCGKTLYMRRDADDKTKFQSLDGQWNGQLADDVYTVSRDDDWQLVFRNGQLQQLTTDTHRIFGWIYQNNIAMEIKEEGAALPVLSVMDDSQAHPAQLLVNGKSYKFSLGQRPQIAVIEGQMVVQGFDQSLTQWVWPDGKKETYEFAIQDKNPTLTVTDSQSHENTYVWDFKSRKIIAEEGWKYQVGNTAQPFALPSISRTNLAGKTEGITIDTQTGQTTITKLDGSQLIYSEIQTPGLLYGKVRKVEKIVNGVTSIVARAAYDDTGKLLRKTDERGFTTIFKYDDNGIFQSKVILPPTDPAILRASNKMSFGDA